jgi:hypothetical protein
MLSNNCANLTSASVPGCENIKITQGSDDREVNILRHMTEELVRTIFNRAAMISYRQRQT